MVEEKYRKTGSLENLKCKNKLKELFQRLMEIDVKTDKVFLITLKKNYVLQIFWIIKNIKFYLIFNVICIKQFLKVNENIFLTNTK